MLGGECKQQQTADGLQALHSAPEEAKAGEVKIIPATAVRCQITQAALVEQVGRKMVVETADAPVTGAQELVGETQAGVGARNR